MESPNGAQRNIDRIAALFPSVITESVVNGQPKKVVDFEKLRQLLSNDVLEGDEAYEFTWVGKRAAIAEANRPIRKTLRPYPNESRNWDTTENLYIEGDNLEVLKLLQENYMGKVKMIYIDPPYNTGNDFIYNDNFTLSVDSYDNASGAVNDEGEKMFKNTDSNGRFHSDWCSMMYSRLTLARNLLTEDGSIFISIDYNEVDNLKKIMDEIFGEDNFQREIIWRIGWLSGYKTSAPNFIRNHDTILFYSKNNNQLDFIKKYLHNTEFKPLIKNDKNLETKMFALGIDKAAQKELLQFINHDNRPERYPIEDTWNCNEYDDLNSIAIVSFSGEKISKILDLEQDFKGQKSIKMLSRIIESTTRHGDIIMDFFSGTASTAHAVMQVNAANCENRNFIMVQLPERSGIESSTLTAGYASICDIGKERMRRVGNCIKDAVGLRGQDLDIGFRVFKVDESNMADVYYSPAEMTQEKLAEQRDNIRRGRSALDLFFGCILDWGLPLSLPYTSEEMEGCTIHTYNNGDLIACFDRAIPESVIEAIAKRNPLRAVFRDSCFADSPAKINVSERFKHLSPNTTVKVI